MRRLPSKPSRTRAAGTPRRLDPLAPAERSERMRRVRGKDTKPEMAVRRLVHRMGYRYRLHAGALPGRPDLVFPSRASVIFVHGCFWHLHAGCRNNRPPKSREDFWRPKLEGNRRRDRRNAEALRRLGWRRLTVWECQLNDEARLTRRIRAFLEGAG